MASPAASSRDERRRVVGQLRHDLSRAARSNRKGWIAAAWVCRTTTGEQRLPLDPRGTSPAFQKEARSGNARRNHRAVLRRRGLVVDAPRASSSSAARPSTRAAARVRGGAPEPSRDAHRGQRARRAVARGRRHAPAVGARRRRDQGAVSGPHGALSRGSPAPGHPHRCPNASAESDVRRGCRPRRVNGANTAIFSSSTLRPAAASLSGAGSFRPDLGDANTKNGDIQDVAFYPDVARRAQSRSFDGMAAFVSRGAMLAGDARANVCPRRRRCPDSRDAA